MEPRNKDGVEDIVYTNSHSSFILGTDEQEILDIVKTFKNKKSSDSDCTEINMALAKILLNV